MPELYSDKILNAFTTLLIGGLGMDFNLAETLSFEEWDKIYELSKKQAVLGITFKALDSLEQPYRPPLRIYAKWALAAEKIENKNKLLNERSREIYERFKALGMPSCILKGQGIARYYNTPELRQCGDIDIWVPFETKETVRLLKTGGIRISEMFYHHCDVHLFKDAQVEVHFKPCFMNGYFANRKLQKMFASHAQAQMSNFDETLGFSVPDCRFATFHCIVHIFRHLFFEGIGLRQICDLYCIMKHLSSEDRPLVMKDLRSLGLGRFTAALMWILADFLQMDKQYLLCNPDKKSGEILLREVMEAGNFGTSYSQAAKMNSSSVFTRACAKLKRLPPFVIFCPSEVLAAPFYKSWQHLWQNWWSKKV